jgi:hypothetical protein
MESWKLGDYKMKSVQRVFTVQLENWLLSLADFVAQNAYENLDPRIDVRRQSQNFVIPEFIFNFGKLGDYKIFVKLMHSLEFR